MSSFRPSSASLFLPIKPFQTFLLSFTCICANLEAQDENPELDFNQEKKHLQSVFADLQSYHATYLLDSGDGKAGSCEVAFHGPSGWALTKVSATDKDQQTRVTRTILLSPEKLKITSVQEEGKEPKYLVISGIGEYFSFIREFYQGVGRSTARPARRIPRVMLTPDNMFMTINYGNTFPPGLHGAEKVLKITPKETTVVSTAYGKVTLDRRTGLIKKQLLDSKDEPRVMKLVDLRLGIDQEFFESRLPTNLEDLETVHFKDLGLAAQGLSSFFQTLIEAPQPLDLETQLALRQRTLISFLDSTLSREFQILGQDRLLGPLREKLEMLSQERATPVIELIKQPGFKSSFLKGVAIGFRKVNQNVPNEKIITTFLGAPFQAGNPREEARKKLVEDYFIMSLQRVELERVMTAYRQEIE